MFIISFDFGMKNIGVAIGQLFTKTANPIGSLNAKNGIPVNWLYIKKLIDIWLLKKAVVGYPIMGSSNKKIFYYINKFAESLKNKFGLKVYFFDEMYSSYESNIFIKKKTIYNSFYSKHNIHSISAVVILERWLEYN